MMKDHVNVNEQELPEKPDGRKKNGGRKAGVGNKKTLATKALFEKQGVDPLQFMINIMQDETADMAIRLDAAKHAAPYVHSKLTSTVIRGAGENGEHIIRIDPILALLQQVEGKVLSPSVTK